VKARRREAAKKRACVRTCLCIWYCVHACMYLCMYVHVEVRKKELERQKKRWRERKSEKIFEIECWGQRCCSTPLFWNLPAVLYSGKLLPILLLECETSSHIPRLCLICFSFYVR